MLRDSVGIPAVDAIGEGSDRQCRSRLKDPVGQARTQHNCHCLSRPWRQEILRKNVNCLTVRLHRVRRSFPHVAHPRPFQRMGTTMRGRTVRLVVAVGVALVGISAIGSVIAYSAVERARVAQENVTKPVRPPPPKAEFRLSDQEELRKIVKPFRLPGPLDR